NRRHIERSVKESIIVLSTHLKQSHISRMLNVSTRTIRRLVLLSRRTGSIVAEPLRRGRLRVLNALDVAYLESIVDRTPDIYLEELQVELEEGRGIHVSTETVRMTLKRAGYTRKKVR
ncbi:hypothetical protein FIBSPDRAFT_667424, partial [Athelia psychrophila]